MRERWIEIEIEIESEREREREREREKSFLSMCVKHSFIVVCDHVINPFF